MTFVINSHLLNTLKYIQQKMDLHMFNCNCLCMCVCVCVCILKPLYSQFKTSSCCTAYNLQYGIWSFDTMARILERLLSSNLNNQLII